MKVLLLTGAKNNCGDYLICDRARKLFRHFLPNVQIVEVDRTEDITDAGFRQMQQASLIVLVGGPLIRSNCAEALHLAPLIQDGRLDAVCAPIVIMGGGAKPPVPFVPSSINPTMATRLLLNRIEQSPFYSGTRDFETLALLRNIGYGNFRFTGCPALYSLPELERPFVPLRLDFVKRIVFSCGAPGLMSEEAVCQHLNVLDALRRQFPTVDLVVAAHHSMTENTYRSMYGRLLPKTCLRFCMEIEKRGLVLADISGGLYSMEKLYASADLHVGYRVHAHVLMTSWRRPSILLAEDGRASGMSDIVSGRVWAAWNCKSVRSPVLSRLFGKKKSNRVYDNEIGERIVETLLKTSARNQVLNQMKYPSAFDEMKRWFTQFAQLDL